MKSEKTMRSEKIQMFDDVAGIIVGAEYVYFVTYKGLKSKEINAFKDDLAKCDAQCHVLKNRLIRKVAEMNGMTALAETKLTGDTAVVVGKGDAGQVAKVIEDFSKTDFTLYLFLFFIIPYGCHPGLSKTTVNILDTYDSIYRWINSISADICADIFRKFRDSITREHYQFSMNIISYSLSQSGFAGSTFAIEYDKFLIKFGITVHD